MTDQVRAKLRVHHIQPAANGNGGTVNMHATYGPGNEGWSAATPSAQFSMFVQNPDAFAFFEQVAEVYIDFTRA